MLICNLSWYCSFNSVERGKKKERNKEHPTGWVTFLIKQKTELEFVLEPCQLGAELLTLPTVPTSVGKTKYVQFSCARAHTKTTSK